MINSDIVKPGEHCWALIDNELVIVLKDSDGDFAVCGYWECSVFEKGLKLIEIIPKPGSHIDTRLYYEHQCK